MSSKTVATGACFCGAVTAEMDGSPFWICFDHDDDCRRAIGSPLTVRHWIGYRPHQVKMLGANPRSHSKTKGGARTFCQECGTSIGCTDEALSDEVYVTIGFMNDPEHFIPQAHAYWQMKLPWMNFGDCLPGLDKYSRPRGPSIGYPADR